MVFVDKVLVSSVFESDEADGVLELSDGFGEFSLVDVCCWIVAHPLVNIGFSGFSGFGERFKESGSLCSIKFMSLCHLISFVVEFFYYC